MSKLIDKMAEEMAREIMKKEDVSETYTKQEVLMFCKCFVGKISEIVSDWVEKFIEKEIKEDKNGTSKKSKGN